MARLNNDIRITPSVLDRLIDFEPRETRDDPRSQSASVQDLKLAVRRDLEWLLNTRCTTDLKDGELEETQKSVAMYGLPDFTGLSVRNSQELKGLTSDLEDAIRLFEPRFIGLKITFEPMNSVDRQIKFNIEAHLDVEPVPEPISFDTVLQIGSGDFSITEK